MKLYTSVSSSKLSITETTESRAVLNICEYVFSVSSIFVCPKYLATNVTLASLLISSDAHECLKSWILITFKPTELEVPEYHIVPSKVVADKIKKDHANWIKTLGRNGKQHNDNSMRKFSDKEDKYLNNWEYMK